MSATPQQFVEAQRDTLAMVSAVLRKDNLAETWEALGHPLGGVSDRYDSRTLYSAMLLQIANLIRVLAQRDYVEPEEIVRSMALAAMSVDPGRGSSQEQGG